MSEYVVRLDSPEAANAERFGPKAANQAALALAGLPVAVGFCIDAAAYRAQLRALGLEEAAQRVFKEADDHAARMLALQVRIGLHNEPIAPEIAEPLLAAWREMMAKEGTLGVVRSSALVEDRDGSSFAGQFESFLGLETEEEFLTSVRACWGALWAPRALRYMAANDLDPGDTAMGLVLQPLVQAKASGGGLSRTAEGEMLLSATWGLGSAIAQGEVVPDRIRLSRELDILEMEAGRKEHADTCVHKHGSTARAVAHDLVLEPCLDDAHATELGRMLLIAEEKVVGGPAEIEWAMDEDRIVMLQARPLQVAETHEVDEVWNDRPRLNGHPAGLGWGTGRACVVNCECELSRVAPGDILVTQIAGPALSQVLPKVGGVVAELGGSTSHLASLARERGVPMVLGVLNATTRIPDGSMVAVDGVAGVVRWMPGVAAMESASPDAPMMMPPTLDWRR
jgi:pyruvate,water dikinase